MSYKKYIEPKAIELASEHGFKFLKSKKTGYKKYDSIELRFWISFGTLGATLSLYVINKELAAYVEGSINVDLFLADGGLLRINSSSAFSSDKEFTYRGEIELSYDTYDVAPEKFEKLFREFVVPWFEKNCTYKGIRQTLRDNGATGALWKPVFDNKEISSHCHWTRFPRGFYQDVVLSKIIQDHPYSAQDIYAQYWEKPIDKYLNTWDEKEEYYYKDVPELKEVYEQIPEIINKLEAITEEEWEKFR
ncbi:hypothetical protein [Saccharicrinis aurantiacus]|uniref:hypothetical protein n=1 Tax=Saccharicrinis aurantiacus TaxID=1849719 RepID=UPI00094FD1C2|nr:hypothetical protein [Saccharicrinis aurantiacus]